MIGKKSSPKPKSSTGKKVLVAGLAVAISVASIAGLKSCTSASKAFSKNLSAPFSMQKTSVLGPNQMAHSILLRSVGIKPTAKERSEAIGILFSHGYQINPVTINECVGFLRMERSKKYF